MPKNRKATHAGSWYTDNSQLLSRQLDEWLCKAVPTQSPARAIIAPHAGYFYCGACCAHAYRQIDPTNVRRVFILGPSHTVRLTGCALSGLEKYETPLYDLPIDADVYDELYASKLFETMKLEVDEDEHSIEMHLPYIARVMESRKGHFKIVPVLVGSLTTESEQMYGSIFSRYLADPSNIFVVSSDFCHWGRRFRYTFYDKKCGEIWNSIKNLDEMGMDIIEKIEPLKFTNYLKEYQNTICGRHPISVLLNAADAMKKNGNGYQMTLKFVQYAQSNQCKSMDDSSVSYAAAALIIS